MPEEDLPGGSFDACVLEMQEDGHDEAAAENICGALLEESKHENGDVAELRQSLETGRGLIADVSVDLNSAVDVPAIDSQWVAMKDADSDYNVRTNARHVFKADGEDSEKRISYAPAMIPRALDKEGDVVGTPTVEQAAHDYLTNDGGVDTDHNLIDGKGEVVESWIEPSAREWELPDGTTKEYPAGTWMLGIKWGSETWDRIKSGELEGLSIYGMAEKVELGKDFSVPFASEAVVHVVYESETAAEKAAEDLGLTDDGEGVTHTHELDGMEVYMPGETHDDFVEAYMDEARTPGVEGDGGEDSEPVENSTESPADGETDNGADSNQSKQNNTMTDPSDGDGESTVDPEAFKELQSTVESIKDAVDTEADAKNQPGDTSNALDNLVTEIAEMEDVDMETSAIRDHLKELFSVSDKEDGMDGDEMDDEDDEEEMESSKSAESNPNLGKTVGTQDTASAAKSESGSSGIPSYREAVEKAESEATQ